MICNNEEQLKTKQDSSLRVITQKRTKGKTHDSKDFRAGLMTKWIIVGGSEEVRNKRRGIVNLFPIPHSHI